MFNDRLLVSLKNMWGNLIWYKISKVTLIRYRTHPFPLYKLASSLCTN